MPPTKPALPGTPARFLMADLDTSVRPRDPLPDLVRLRVHPPSGRVGPNPAGGPGVGQTCPGWPPKKRAPVQVEQGVQVVRLYFRASIGAVREHSHVHRTLSGE